MSLKRNVIANFLGQGWKSLMGFVFIPLYIHYLGVEAYGLIGMFAVLLSWVGLLNLGMTPTLNREMARFSAGAHSHESIHDLVRSFELICLGLALTIFVAFFLSSTWLATDWFKVDDLPIPVVAEAIAFMALVASFSFINGLYRGGIIGLQKQVLLNLWEGTYATIGGGGAVLVLMFISADIKTFFIWQSLVAVLTTITLAFMVHNALPSIGRSARFSWKELKKVRHFAAGMMIITLLALMLTQIDKVILSRILDLKTLGYYVLATTVANILLRLVGPIEQAYFPRFTQMVTTQDVAQLAKSYHQGSQLSSLVLGPLAAIFVLFGENILRLWTANSTIAMESGPLLSVLAIGTLLNGMMHIPYMLQLAYGWSSFTVRVNTVAVIILVPAIFWVAPKYGAMGTALIWLFLNAAYVFVVIHLMHRKLLPRDKWCWYRTDWFVPLAISFLIGYVSKWGMPMDMPWYVETLWIVLTWILMVAATFRISPQIYPAFRNARWRGEMASE